MDLSFSILISNLDRFDIFVLDLFNNKRTDFNKLMTELV